MDEAPPVNPLESHSAPVLFWGEALAYLRGAQFLGGTGSPAVFLGCHGIELALKAHLRAKGASLAHLKELGHNLKATLRECVQSGMGQPPPEVRDVLTFIAPAHLSQQFRYMHTRRPRTIAVADVLLAGAWSLDVASNAVAEDMKVPPSSPRRGLMRSQAFSLSMAYGHIC